MDPRYGCFLCSTLPHPGYLYRLRKGRDKGKQKYSLQHHVETYHPDITDWESLKTNLEKFVRPGNRKRKRENLIADSPEPGSSSSSSDGDTKQTAAPPKRTLRPRPRSTRYDDDYESDTIVVKIGKGKKAAEDEEEEEETEEEQTDEEMEDAPPPKRQVRGSASTVGTMNQPVSVDDEEETDEETDYEMGNTGPQRQPLPPHSANDYGLAGIPIPDTTAVQPRPPRRRPTVRELMVGNSAKAAAPYRRTATMDGLQNQNIALTSSVQGYERVNNGLRDEVRGLLYVTANAIEAALVGNEPTTQNIHQWLSIHARQDGGISERFAARLVTELSRRYDERNGPRPAQPQRLPSVHEPLSAFQRRPLTDAELMPPPPRPDISGLPWPHNIEEGDEETDEEDY